MRRLVVYTVMFSAVLAAGISSSTDTSGARVEGRERPSYALSHGCSREYASQWARNRIRVLLLRADPSPDRGLVRRLARCVATRKKARAGRRVERRAWEARRTSYGLVWRIRFARLPASWRAWAWSTGACESGNDPSTSTGNGFYGAFQWVPSTWYAAGGTGWPSAASWHHQAVVAVGLAIREGTGHWPNCG